MVWDTWDSWHHSLDVNSPSSRRSAQAHLNDGKKVLSIKRGQAPQTKHFASSAYLMFPSNLLAHAQNQCGRILLKMEV